MRKKDYLGKHFTCGGKIFLYTGFKTIRGYRKCQKCGASTKKCDTVFTIREASMWK